MLFLYAAENEFLVAMHEVLQMKVMSIERGQVEGFSFGHTCGCQDAVHLESICIRIDVHMRAKNGGYTKQVGIV